MDCKFIAYISLIGMCLLPIASFSQEGQTISGLVVSMENRKAVANATIQLSNRTFLSQSDASGRFSLRVVSFPDTLIVSHVGYREQLIPLDSATGELQILLEREGNMIEEVRVSSGYQTIRKDIAPGSYLHIDDRVLLQQVQTNILDGLPILTSSMDVAPKNNVTPNRISIRGLSTIEGPQSPLIVLDNFPYEGEISNINPHDVESITVLRDAAASSIWGARAGNGVIVINTKRGLKSDRLQVDVSASMKVARKPDLFYLPRIPSSEIIEVEKFLFQQGYRFADTANARRPPFSPVYELLFQHQDGQLPKELLDDELQRLAGIDVHQGFTDHFYVNGVNQQYAISLRKGGDVNSWFTSVGYDNNQSALHAINERLSMRTGNDLRIGNQLLLSTSLDFTSSGSRSGRTDITEIRQQGGGLPPYTTFFSENGEPKPFFRDYRETFVREATENPNLLDWHYYPSDDYRHQKLSSTMQYLKGNVGLAYTPLPWMGFELKYQYHQEKTNSELFYDEESYYARNIVNQFYQTEDNSFAIPLGGILDRSGATIKSNNLRGQINVNKSWDEHDVQFLFGGEMRSVETHRTNSRHYGYDSQLLMDKPVNYVTRYRSFVSGEQMLVPRNNSFTGLANRFLSVYANAFYAFRDRYILSASARRDAANIFGVRTNERWTPLWSAGASWLISREPFYGVSSHLPFLKVKATYGYSGNIDPSKSALTTIIYSNISPYTLSPYARVDRFYNPDLRWEKSRQINLGVEFRFKDEWGVSGSLEYYHKKGIDLYGPSPVDYTAGIGMPSIVKNVASMKANGIDAILNTSVATGAVNWSMVFNASFYRDRVTSYFLRDLRGRDFVGSGVGITGIENKPLRSIYSFRWAGLDEATGDPLGYDHNGQISKEYNVLTGNDVGVEDLVFHGTAAPRFFGSIGNTLSWKGLSLSFFIGYKTGYRFRRPSISYSALFSQLGGHIDYMHRWEKPGDEARTHVPSLQYPVNSAREAFYLGSEVLVDRGDHIRLQYVYFEYDFAQTPIASKYIRGAKIFANGNNLGIIWAANKHGLDPDYTSTAIPASRDMAFGIKLNF